MASAFRLEAEDDEDDTEDAEEDMDVSLIIEELDVIDINGTDCVIDAEVVLPNRIDGCPGLTLAATVVDVCPGLKLAALVVDVCPALTLAPPPGAVIVLVTNCVVVDVTVLVVVTGVAPWKVTPINRETEIET